MTDGLAACKIAHSPAMAAAPEDAGQEQEVNAPVVFFCASCHHIVGDTLAFACANEGLQAITLTGAIRAPVQQPRMRN